VDSQLHRLSLPTSLSWSSSLGCTTSLHCFSLPTPLSWSSSLGYTTLPLGRLFASVYARVCTRGEALAALPWVYGIRCTLRHALPTELQAPVRPTSGHKIGPGSANLSCACTTKYSPNFWEQELENIQDTYSAYVQMPGIACSGAGFFPWQ
jgi:hypothetical protein